MDLELVDAGAPRAETIWCALEDAARRACLRFAIEDRVREWKHALAGARA